MTRPTKDAPGEDEEDLMKLLDQMQLDTGDVVLFDRKCSAMSLYGGLICYSAKAWGGTRWDHNGVVVKTDDGKLMFLEAAMTGVKLRPLIDRIRYSKSYEVRIQKVEVNRTPEFRQRAAEFVQRVIAQDIPYEDRVQVLINAGADFVPSRVAREQLFNDIVDLKRRMKTIQDDMTHRTKMSPFEQNSLRTELQHLREQHDALVEQLDATERSVFENKASKADATRYFCSQLVAALYQHVGLLLPYPAANSYRPHNFSETSDYVKLQNASWLPEISLREKLAETRARLVDTAVSAPPPPAALEKIVHSLRRHAVFHSFTETELRALAATFQRKRFASGQVVFYQGMTGDFFYVIDSGTVDVLVDYDAYSTQLASTKDAAEPVAKLRRNQSSSFHDATAARNFVHVATNGPGNAFGDSALMYGTPRRATVKCSDELVAYALDKDAFTAAVKAHPAATQSLAERQFLMQTLANHPLFASVSEQAQAAAVRKVRRCFSLQFPKGATVLEQGQFGDYFYVVEKGSCAITRHHADGGEEFLDRIVGRGDAFGEAALLYNSRRGASVHAVEDSKIWCMVRLDRSILLSTTRSGSTTLLDIFNKTASDHDDETGQSFLTKDDIAHLFEDPSGVQTAQTLLFPDDLSKINFSQFAHFHMCLEAYSSRTFNPLLAEAMYRSLRGPRHADHVLTSAALPSRLDIPATATPQLQKYFGKASPNEPITYHDCVAACQAWSTNPKLAPTAISALLTLLHRDLQLLEEKWKHTAFDMKSPAKTSQTTSEAPVPFRSLFSFQDVLAAIVAGVFARSATAPLERLKLARQVGLLPANINVVQSFQRMARVAGWQSLFAGNFMHCVKTAPSFPLKLVACDLFRQHFHDLGFNAEVKNALAGGCAGVTVQAVLYPLDVIRGRMALQQILTPTKVYPTVASCIHSMYVHEGIGAFYRGFAAASLGVFPYIGLNFAVYEFLRPWLVVQQQHPHRPADHAVSSAVAGQIACALGASVTAQVATFPLDVVRRKMQMQGAWLAPHAWPTYTSTWDCFRQTAREASYGAAFYRGLAPNCIKALPASVLSFVAYEALRQGGE
ncbi:Aste57867_12999 [Aphanomyces stellatus]|uniref:Aste57867_12999 protein n=1 Tax=Aphanomyces stellatus TaxID=120398 RepID=A0A485KX26_9STRA|nr:hypothetical protein As57867_012951 [Aphanomyces stellatus]VFT89845.1 Aste57867_12999 [Aphanomyces stellatus]